MLNVKLKVGWEYRSQVEGNDEFTLFGPSSGWTQRIGIYSGRLHGGWHSIAYTLAQDVSYHYLQANGAWLSILRVLTRNIL